MKHFLLFLALFSVSVSMAQTQFWADNFESSPSGGTRTPEENGGTTPAPSTAYFKLTDGSDISQAVAFTNKQGTYYWAGEDHNAAGTGFTSSGAQGAAVNSTLNELQIDWTGINIAGKSNLSFRGLLAANSTSDPWDNTQACNSGVGTTNTDYIIVEYNIDGGAYQPLIRFFNRGSASGVGDKYLFEDTDGNGCGDGTQLTNVFSEFTKTIAGTGTTMNLRIRVFSEGTNEEWGIDNFRLYEIAACTAPVIIANPPNRMICAGNNTTFSGTATGATAYQWQVNTGSGFTDITNGGVYSGATTTTLTITGATAGMSGYLYRLTAINGSASCFTNSSNGSLTVSSISTTGAQTNIACNGGTTGAASVSPSGGITPYTYSWSPSGGTSAIASNLAAGTYTVTVTDNIGCTATRNYTLTQPPVLNGTTVVTNVACFGGNTGAINLTPSGGSPGYTYSWGGGITTEDRTSLTAGTYSVVITDANGCTKTVNATLTQPTAPVSGTTVVTNVACFGGNTGAINLTPTGGVGPYTFNWASGPTTEDRTNLVAGTYSVTITDANGCTGTVNATVTQPTSPVSGTTVVTNVACFGGNTGAINLTPTGGVGPYTFNWASGPTTEDRTNLVAGTYSVTITDANGCTGTVNATVTQPTSPVSGTTVVTNVACFGGNTGAINLTPTGGVGPYTFNWASGPTTEDRTNLVAGTYSVTITDANGCTGTVNATVTQPTSPVTDANGCTGTVNATVTQPTSPVSGTTVVTNVACFGGNTGAINLTPTGGVGPYTFNWASGPTTEDRTNLVAGTYSVTITDANGCTGTVNATVTQPTSPVSGTTVVTNVACFGGNTGAINLTPTGGVGPYTFNWASGPTTEDRTNLVAGTYSVTITDANGCTGTVNATVTQPTSPVSGTTVVTNVACFGGNTGAINLTPTGGVGPYTFNWASGPTTEDRTNLVAGTYSVTITDANGCTGTVNATVTQPTSPVSGTTVVTNVACFGGNTGAINLTPTGGVGPYTFNWASGPTTEDRTNLVAGTYSVTITDANGCTGTVNATITAPAPLVVASSSQTNVSCNGGSNGTATVSVSGGTPGYLYSWTPNAGTTATVNGLNAGTYLVQITDANGCQTTQTFAITEPTALDASAGSQTDVLCNGSATGSATVAPTGGTGNYTYSWSPSGGANATATGLSAGTYTVTVTDDNSCQDTRTFTITEPALITSSFSESACNSYTWGTQTHSASGTYNQTFTASNGCDSIVTLNLTIVSEVTNTVIASSCNAYTWAQNGMTYTASGMYVDTIPTAGGCDSIVTLDLTINTPSGSSSSEFACGSYTWAENGVTYTTSGVYTATLPNAAGCDSVITLNLTIGGTSTLQPASACGSYTWAANGVTYTTSGMYFDTLTDINGCDSIQILDLTINPAFIATASDNGNATITASAGFSYQWINCTTNTPVIGATAQTFAPTENGFYAVFVTNGTGCSDTSDCVEIDNLGLSDLNSVSVQVFPNPTENVVTISMSVNSANLTICDAQGKTLYTGQISNDQQVNLASFEDGVYFFSVETENGKVLKRIIKN